MEDRYVSYTLIKEIHRFTNRLNKCLKQESSCIKNIGKEELDLLKETIDNLIKIYNAIQN